MEKRKKRTKTFYVSPKILEEALHHENFLSYLATMHEIAVNEGRESKFWINLLIDELGEYRFSFSDLFKGSKESASFGDVLLEAAEEFKCSTGKDITNFVKNYLFYFVAEEIFLNILQRFPEEKMTEEAKEYMKNPTDKWTSLISEIFENEDNLKMYKEFSEYLNKKGIRHSVREGNWKTTLEILCNHKNSLYLICLFYVHSHPSCVAEHLE